MSDPIDEIDRLHADKYSRDSFAGLMRQHWPAIRDRLREAEQRLANAYGPESVTIRDLASAGEEIARLQAKLAEAERKARAFDAIARDISQEGSAFFIRASFFHGDAGHAAIESALRGEEKSK